MMVDLFIKGFGLGAASGSAIAVAVTYLATMHFKGFNSVKSFYEGKEAALDELHVERHVEQSQTGIVFKKYRIHVQERLVYKHFPISPFWEHTMVREQKLDERELNALMDAGNKLLGIADLKKLGLRVLTSRVFGGAPEAATQARKASKT